VAASRASLRRTYSLRDRPNRRACVYRAATTSSGTSRISMFVITASQLVSHDVAHWSSRAKQERRRQPWIYPRQKIKPEGARRISAGS
jgi:hypothetical protein